MYKLISTCNSKSYHAYLVFCLIWKYNFMLLYYSNYKHQSATHKPTNEVELLTWNKKIDVKE